MCRHNDDHNNEPLEVFGPAQHASGPSYAHAIPCVCPTCASCFSPHDPCDHEECATSVQNSAAPSYQIPVTQCICPACGALYEHPYHDTPTS